MKPFLFIISRKAFSSGTYSKQFLGALLAYQDLIEVIVLNKKPEKYSMPEAFNPFLMDLGDVVLKLRELGYINKYTWHIPQKLEQSNRERVCDVIRRELANGYLAGIIAEQRRIFEETTAFELRAPNAENKINSVFPGVIDFTVENNKITFLSKDGISDSQANLIRSILPEIRDVYAKPYSGEALKITISFS
jgi:hypothetical protein